MSSHERLTSPGTPPSAARLLRSTALAAAIAAVVLVLVVLPAAYGLDVTGLGRVLGLTQRGELNMMIAAEEAAASASAGNAATAPAAADPAPTPTDSVRETTITLAPGEGKEVKLVMQRGAVASYAWSTNGGVVNFLAHGDTVGAPEGVYHTYARGTAVTADSGTIEAVFDGNHGWFWRNRSTDAVTVTLRTRGDYQGIKTP